MIRSLELPPLLPFEEPVKKCENNNISRFLSPKSESFDSLYIHGLPHLFKQFDVFTRPDAFIEFGEQFQLSICISMMKKSD